MDQLQHFGHVHPLMFKEGEQKNEDGAAASPPVDCSKCGDPVLSPSYSCNQCSELFILHKSCALLPRMMHHPIHRKHLLVLVPDRTNYICDICGNGHSSSFGYTCEQDGFDLDLQCALNLSNTKFLEHFSHRHALMFMEEPKRESKDSLVVCSGCREQVIGPSYCCSLLQCYYTLHKSCAELPREMHHPKHVKHPLVLFSHSDHRCHFCDKLRTNIFSYTCEQCDFELDLQCASNSSDIKCLEHFSHERALMFMEEPKRKSKDSLVVCDGCQEQVFGPSYCCSQFHCY